LRLTYIISYFDTHDRTHNGDESPKGYIRSTFGVRCEQRSDMTSNEGHVMYLLSYNQQIHSFIAIAEHNETVSLPNHDYRQQPIY